MIKKVSGTVSGTVDAIPSKSHVHRLLISASLAGGATEIICKDSSADIDATAACMRAIGADIIRTDNGFTVNPIRDRVAHAAQKKETAVLDCGESGSTLRFILPIIFALGGEYTIQMSGRLPERPLFPLDRELFNHGCSIEGIGTDTLKCSGKLTNGVFTLPGNISSQFISGLLFALPLLSGDSRVKLTTRLESRAYVDITMEVLKDFGIEVICGKDEFTIPGGQSYRSPEEITADGDWSNAAFWLCAGAIGGEGITCKGLNPNSKQGDKAITELLKRFGANVDITGDSVTVSPGELRGIEIDAENIPDLVPVLAVVASAAHGKTVIFNAGRLRIKESDRLKTVTDMLTIIGAEVTETESGLIINGKALNETVLNKARAKAILNGGVVSSYGDHRIAMSAAVASTVCGNAVIIENAGAVSKSYPGFYDDFAALGGRVEEVD